MVESDIIIYFNDKYLSEVEKILKDSPDVFSENDFKQFREDLLSYLLEKNHNNSRVMILYLEKKVRGIIMIKRVEDSKAYFVVQWLAVLKAEQNKGYGTKLVQYALHETKKLGGKSIYVQTSNEKHNEKTKIFYENLGFKKGGVLPDFYPPPLKGTRKYEDEIIYYKDL